jgi:hypothetical protein
VTETFAIVFIVVPQKELQKKEVFLCCSREEAAVMRANHWLYHYYMVQSRLQYNLAYGGQPSTIAALYPQMMHMISPNSFDNAPMAAFSPAGEGDQYYLDNYGNGFNAAFGRGNSCYEKKEKEVAGGSSEVSSRGFYPRSPPMSLQQQQQLQDCSSRSESSTPPVNAAYPPYDGDEYGGAYHSRRAAAGSYYPHQQLQHQHNGSGYQMLQGAFKAATTRSPPVDVGGEEEEEEEDDNNNHCEVSAKSRK